MILSSSSSCRYSGKLQLPSFRRDGVVASSRVLPRLSSHLRSRTGRRNFGAVVRSTGEEGPVRKLKESRRAELLWDGFDLVSVGGTITGALLVIFGSDLMFLTLPIGFPLISLFVGIRRERHKTKVGVF